MSMNPLPPQAYTKDTLLRAYHWIQQQPQNIRELATSPDLLVSLYLKAHRDGADSLERPSIQNFKSELRNLAGMIGELDKGSPPLTAHKNSENQTLYKSAETQKLQPSTDSLQRESQTHQANLTKVESHFHLGAPSVSFSAPPLSAEPSPSPKTLPYDPKTVEMLKETMTKFNLSSENEALRMLVKLGFERAQKLFEECH